MMDAFWIIFSLSFLVALTGAMSPGPLLTYTIIKSVSARQRGYLMGVWIILGHAILELAIILCLLLGFSVILKNIIVLRMIGVIGGVILLFFGVSIIRDVMLKKISADFSDSSNAKIGFRISDNPIIGGIMVSMSNPYWWVWWATIGLAFMVQYKISHTSWLNLIAFFLGHEAGDLLWYLLISTLSFFGLRKLNEKVYSRILLVCGMFMMLFGVYLGLSPFVSMISLS